MRAALTRDEAFEVLHAALDRPTLDRMRETSEGEIAVEALVDIFLELDAQGADDAAQLFIAHASHEIADPATGATFATTTCEIARSRPDTGPRTIPAGTPIVTPDGHRFVTLADVTFGAAEVGVWKEVDAVATVAGPMGAIPPGELATFERVAKGVTGVGKNVTLHPSSGQPKHIYFETDTAKPHPFASKHVGLYVRVESVDDVAFQGNVGRSFQIARVNGANPWSSTPTTEGAFARSAELNTTTDASLSGWTTGAHGFEWRVLDWGEDLGFLVRNKTAVTRARRGLLDERGAARGRPRQDGEPDAAYRPRLLRKPQAPTPIGLLRKVTLAAAAYGFNRREVRIYEMGEPAAHAADPYRENFPAAMGFIADLHCADMPTPETPDGMAAVDPDYAPLTTYVNPGLALTDGGDGAPCFPRWCVLVRIDTPLTGATLAAFRKSVFEAASNGVQPGCLVLLYHPPQQGFP